MLLYTVNGTVESLVPTLCDGEYSSKSYRAVLNR